MLVVGFPAQALGTNCWVVAPATGEQCVVIDPGVGVEAQLDEVLRQHRLTPVAVLLTHGHFDHTFAAAAVCAARDVPAWIHPADRGQLTDPWSGVGLPVGTPLADRTTFAEPADVRELVDGERLALGGVEFEVTLTPGHSPGSVCFGLSTSDGPLLFGGDLLFEGSIGRVDLPGGSEQEMFDSLTRFVLPLEDSTVVHPGHGPSTTIGHERATNPYLRMAAGSLPRTGL